MSSKLRSFAKRLVPTPFLRGVAKGVWDRVKLRQDMAAFCKTNAGAAYVHLGKDAIADLRKRGYHGQVGQDFFLDLLFHKDTGRFLDIGANNPEANSNTFFFEKKGWTGFAFDPMKSLKDRWIGRVGTVFINAGISDRNEIRTFVEILPKAGWEHQLSSFKEFVRQEDLREYNFIEYDVQCSPISELVPGNEVFDFASIDVEGAESLILGGFDLDSSAPKAIMMENVSVIGGVDAHRSHLATKGYRLVARLNASDDLFVHESHPLPKAFAEAVAKYSL